MDTKELAESVKRLRELAKCTEAMTEQSIFKSVRQLNMQYEQGCNDIITLSDGLLDANKTINALVQLVGEMSKECLAFKRAFNALTSKSIQHGYIVNTYRDGFNLEKCHKDIAIAANLLTKDGDTLTKAAPIAELSKQTNN